MKTPVNYSERQKTQPFYLALLTRSVVSTLFEKAAKSWTGRPTLDTRPGSPKAPSAAPSAWVKR